MAKQENQVYLQRCDNCQIICARTSTQQQPPGDEGMRVQLE